MANRNKKRDNKKVLTWITNDTFPLTVMFSMGYNDYEELLKEVSRREGKIISGPGYKDVIEVHRDKIITADYLATKTEFENNKTKKERFFYTIHVRDRINLANPLHLTYLAHECLHICQYFLPRVLDRNKEHEAEAYLHTFLMEAVIAAIGNKKYL